MERTLPPAEAEADDVFLAAAAADFFAAGDFFFALAGVAFVALALGVPLVFAMVKVID